MKALLLSLLAFTSTVAAEPPPPSAPAAPKPPVGVPVDAKFFNGKWYRVYFEKLNWHAARDKCKMLGGQLVMGWEVLHSTSFFTSLAAHKYVWANALTAVL